MVFIGSKVFHGGRSVAAPGGRFDELKQAAEVYANPGTSQSAHAAGMAAAARATSTAREAADKGHLPPANPMQQISRRQADVVEMLSFVQSLGIDPVRESEMLWIAEEAFYAPLPPGWSEHADKRGRVYFHNSTTGESAWQHPLDLLFHEIVDDFRRIQRTGGFWVIDDELAELEENIRKDLSDWQELFDERGFVFYHNRRTDESRTDDPRHAVYHSLYTRIRMVAKMREKLPMLAEKVRPDDPAVRELELAEMEKEKYFRCILRIQACARIIVTRNRVRKMKERRNMNHAPAPLKDQISLCLQDDDSLMIAVTTPHRRTKAATKIQGLIRGFITRRRVRPIFAHRRYAVSVIIKVQRRYRIMYGRKRAWRQERERETRAALVIQRVYRGRKARHFCELIREEGIRAAKEEMSALQIQSQARVWLARREVGRLHLAYLSRQVREVQRYSKRYLAYTEMFKRRLAREPILCSFECASSSEARRFVQWSWQVSMVAVDSGGTLSTTRAPTNLFAKSGVDAWKTVAATRIQKVARGGRSRQLLAQGIGEVRLAMATVWESVQGEIAARQVAAREIQKIARGWGVRRQGLVARLRLEWVARCAVHVRRIQRSMGKFAAQAFLAEGMREKREREGAVRIQTRWRGVFARKQYARLLEAATWPLKGWFQYMPTGKESVRVAIRFFPNPSFDPILHHVEHDNLQEYVAGSLDDMEEAVFAAAEKFLARTSSEQDRPQSSASSRQASAPGTPGGRELPAGGADPLDDAAARGHAASFLSAVEEEARSRGSPGQEPSVELAASSLGPHSAGGGAHPAEGFPFTAGTTVDMEGIVTTSSMAVTRRRQRKLCEPYSGRIRNGRFEKARAASLDDLTETQRQEILFDLEVQRQLKAEQLMLRKQQRKAKQLSDSQFLQSPSRLLHPKVLRKLQHPGSQPPPRAHEGGSKPDPGRRQQQPPEAEKPEKLPKQRVLHRHIHHHMHYHDPDGAGDSVPTLPQIHQDGPGAHANQPARDLSARCTGSKPGPLHRGASAASAWSSRSGSARRSASAADLLWKGGGVGAGGATNPRLPALSASTGQLRSMAAGYPAEEEVTPRRQPSSAGVCGARVAVGPLWPGAPF